MTLANRAKTELTGRRLIWNVLFYGGHIAIFAYVSLGWWKQQADERLALLNTLKFSVWSSRGAGLCLGVDGFLLLLPMLRNLIMFFRPKFTWLMPLDENIWFHRQIAYSLLFFSIIHTTAHYVNMIVVEQVQARPGDTAWGIMYTMPGGFTGHVMLLIMLLMYTTAHWKIRAQCFEVFWYTHHLAFFFMLGLYTHATGCFVRGALPGEPVQCLGYNTVQYTVVSGALYFCERVWREIRSRRETKMVGVLMHPSGAMEIRFKKPSFSYKAGQWLFMQVPDISQFQWHPFTISSCPSDPYISVHIRQAGDWTQALGERLGATPSLAAQLTAQARKGSEKNSLGYGEADFVDVTNLSNIALPVLRIDGPYGAPAEDVFKHEAVILVGTGIGVTPWASVLKHIIYLQKTNKLGALRKVQFIWVNRDTSSFEWFAALLRQLESQIENPELLTINTYLTSKLSEEQIQNVIINDGESDAITSLQARTQFGRPNWQSIFAKVRTGIEQGSFLPGRESSLRNTVGVFYCGPPALAKQLKVETKNASNINVNFKLYKEHF